MDNQSSDVDRGAVPAPTPRGESSAGSATEPADQSTSLRAELSAHKEHIRQLRAQVLNYGGQPVSSEQSRLTAGPRPHNLQRLAQVEVVRSSGLFDVDYYLAQLEPHEEVGDPIAHYVAKGHLRGLQATPFVAEEWYRVQARRISTNMAPLAHYLYQGTRRDLSPHPLFDLQGYVNRYPDSRDHPGGSIGHFLANVDRSSDVQDGSSFAADAQSAATWLLATRGYDHLPRVVDTWDVEKEREFVDGLLRDSRLLQHRPLVSIAIPTYNRAHTVLAAIDSVLSQTYEALELIVVDDGGTDDTEARVRQHFGTDPRVRYVRHEHNRGVSAALNTAATEASGTYMAYLGSDNTWNRDFLEVMLRHIEREGASIAYAVSELNDGNGRVQYRGMPFSREALRERNYIDHIVVVHERALLDQVGVFDESLKRTVDWDLLIRLTDVADFSFAPFRATSYNAWEAGNDRITTEVSEGYRFRVRQRTLINFDDARRKLRDPGVSIVVVVSQDLGLVDRLDRVLAASEGESEIVLVDNHVPEGDAIRLHARYSSHPRVRLERLTKRLPIELARNLGATLGRKSTLVFLPEDAWVEVGWDTALAQALDRHVAVQPLITARGGSVWSAGVSFATGGPVQRYREFAADAPEVRGEVVADAVSARCLAVRAEAFLAAEGFDPLLVNDEDGAELAIRLRAIHRGSTACVGATQVSLQRDMPAKKTSTQLDRALHNEHAIRAAWLASRLSPLPQSDFYDVISVQRTSGDLPELQSLVVHARAERPLRWAIKIGTPHTRGRENWGDWHFANALRDSLENLGHEATVDLRNGWYRSTAHLDDVVLVLQGRGRYMPSPNQVNVLWMLSHPGSAPLIDLTMYHLVFSASPRWSRHASQRGLLAETLLQCTDTRRFHPIPPDPAKRHDVLMVGNARGIRPSVEAALEVGIAPAVYGMNWAGLIPPTAYCGEYIPNDQLPTYYASAGVVLNDHWEDMQRWGIVSNRVFDLAASGARFISDYMPEIATIFGDAVPMFETPAELLSAVETLRLKPTESREKRLKLAALVRDRHSFDARAALLSERVHAHLARTGRPDAFPVPSAAD